MYGPMCVAMLFVFEMTQGKLEYQRTNYMVAKPVLDAIHSHEDSGIIFHFDRQHADLVDEILSRMNKQMIMSSVNMVYYQDFMKIKRDKEMLKRPSVSKVLNVVLLSNMENVKRSLSKRRNVKDQDEALFVTSNLTYSSTDWKKFKIFGKIYVIRVKDNEKFSIKKICYYCGRLGKQDATAFYKKEFKNLHRHSFKVGFTNYYPFIQCRIDLKNTTRCLNATGSEMELIAQLSQRLNFRYQFFLYSNYNTLIDGVVKEKIDFAIGGLTLTDTRAENATFTQQYWFEGYYFLYVLDKRLQHTLGMLLQPFDGRVWSLVISSIIITSAALYAVNRFGRTRLAKISFMQSLWLCVHIAIEQNANLRRTIKSRTPLLMLLAFWMYFCLNVSTAYKSKLAAKIIHPPYQEPGDLQELVENDYKFVVNERYMDVFQTLVLNSTEPAVQKARSRTTSRANLCEEFKYAVENRAAILDEYTSLQYELRTDCKEEIAKVKYTKRIRITKKSLRNIGQVWLLQKGAPYRSAFDQILGRIVEAGLLQKWRATYTKTMRKDSFRESSNSNTHYYHTPLSLKVLLSLFLLYGIGNVCATIVLLTELILHHILIGPD